MRAAGLAAVALVAALVAAALQACAMVCQDCNCPPLKHMVVDSADDADLVGATVQDVGSKLIIHYVKDGVRWTVTYDLTSGDTGV